MPIVNLKGGDMDGFKMFVGSLEPEIKKEVVLTGRPVGRRAIAVYVRKSNEEYQFDRYEQIPDKPDQTGV